jgi:hypothetical protein
MAASVYPSSGWTTLRRHVLPGFAASDIVQGAPVCVASNADSAFVMCTTSAQKPVGVARDYAIAGNPVAVFDFGNQVRTAVGGQGAGASFSRQSYVGIVGTSSMTHPQSGVTVTYGVIGQVTGTASVGVGASTAAVWALGVAYESAALGDFAEYRIEPALLSGIVNSN